MPRWSDYQLSGNLSVFIREYVVTTILIIVILVGVSAAMASEINVVAATIQVFGAALISVALVSPKTGMYLLILATGYLDLIKRLMVVTGQVGMTDITWVLGVAPAMFAAVVLGVIVHRIFQHRVLEAGEEWIVVVVSILMAVNFAIIYRDTASVTQTFQWAANTTGYLPLLLLAGVLFPTPGRIKSFLGYAALVLLPVPLYGIWQFFFGLAGFEYDYLRSGLTITEGYLDDLRPRPFSTLASAHPLTIVCAMFFLLSLLPVRLTRKTWFPFTNWRWLAVSGIYLCGSFASLARTGWVAAGVGLLAIGCFWNRSLTKIFYTFIIAIFFLVVFNADWIEEHVGAIQELLPSGSISTEMAFRVATIGDRLHGWQNIISHPMAFGPFGIPLSERTQEVYVHDQIGEILVNAGYVGFLLILSFVIFAIVKTHQLSWRVRDPEARRLAIICLAVIFGVLTSGAMFGGSTSVYPVNILFWFAAGVIVQMFRLNWQHEKTAKLTHEGPQTGLGAVSFGRQIANSQKGVSLTGEKSSLGPIR